VAFDRGDHRLAEFEAGRPHRRVAAFDAMAPSPRGGLLEVESGAESAFGSGQDGDRERGIGVEAAKAVGQRACSRRIDGVARRRPIEGDDRDGAIGFKADGIGLGHSWIVSREPFARKRNRGRFR